MQGGSVAGHNLTFLRNMLTEGVGSIRTCTDYPNYVGCLPAAAALADLCLAPGFPPVPLSTVQGSIPCPTASAATAAAAPLVVRI